MSSESTPLVASTISHDGPASRNQKRFTSLLGYLQLLLLLFFALGTQMKDSEHYSTEEYIVFRDIMVMLLLGFGFLMTFLFKYGLGAVGLTMMASVIAIELNIAMELLCRFLYGMGGSDDTQLPLPVGFSTIIDGQFAAATLLISYGAIIGRATPLQLALMAVLQALPYAFNKVVLVFGLWGAEDVGGTMTIHMFGAIFGLSVSYVLGPPKEATALNASPKAVSDVMALIGTTLLWVYWPSFVGATETANPEYEQNCLVHTAFALLGSTLATFYMSPKFGHGKLDPVHIANSTLAGGVAVGSSARLAMTPGGALMVGMLAGVASVYGYAYSTPYLEKACHVYDTCGVGNLHGWPSIFGGLASAIFVLIDSDAAFLSRGMFQFLFQILGILGTIFIAVSSGYGTGLLIVKYGSMETKPDEYDDAVWWEGPYFT